MSRSYDTVIVGGGFYGLRIAQFLAEELGQKKVLVLEKVFRVKDVAFNTEDLKDIAVRQHDKLGVEVHTAETVVRIKKIKDYIEVETDKETYQAEYVINTTYSSINVVNAASNLEIVS